MAGACLANTPSATIEQDGAGTTRVNVVIDPHVNNPLRLNATGVVKAPFVVRYGWGAANNFSDNDTFSSAVAISPASGAVEYGPRWAGQVATAIAGYPVGIRIGVDVLCGYSAGANNPFSGVTYEIQAAVDALGFSAVKTVSQNTPSAFAWLWSGEANFPFTFGDVAVHTVTARLMITAGAFGQGEVATAQYMRRHFVEFTY